MLTRMKGMDLQPGYELEELGQNLLLKRPNRYVLAAFGKRVKPENIQRVAKADEKYLRAVERVRSSFTGPESFGPPPAETEKRCSPPVLMYKDAAGPIRVSENWVCRKLGE